MEKIKLEVTEEQIEVIYRGLLELPAKYTLGLIQDLESQFRAQDKPVDKKPKAKKDEGSNIEELQ